MDDCQKRGYFSNRAKKLYARTNRTFEHLLEYASEADPSQDSGGGLAELRRRIRDQRK